MTIGEYGSGIMDTKQTQISIGVYGTKINIVVHGTHTPRLDFDHQELIATRVFLDTSPQS